ncbi:TIGR02996 domain-containing protein [Fimbriiglobus ruber]|uniref:TIGR02996 domain-containing protein n=1 Tax=Fimbriiglobus ruber TaxID=1908690 RepID=UPI000B4BFD54|nr:TIGR02996 domain-containing protein [Fimbriiglobus ruber]
MTERDALLRAVLENPDDDLPRLVMADWLEEHGQESEAVKIRYGVANPHETEGKYLAQAMSFASIRRGFIEQVACPCEVFMAKAGEWFGVQPITRVVLSDKRPHLPHVGRPGETRHLDYSPWKAFYWNSPYHWSERFMDWRGDNSVPHVLPAQLLSRFPPEYVKAVYEQENGQRGMHRRGYEFPAHKTITSLHWDNQISYRLIYSPQSFNLSFDPERYSEICLSAACVSYGRTLAGLSPYTPGV